MKKTGVVLFILLLLLAASACSSAKAGGSFQEGSAQNQSQTVVDDIRDIVYMYPWYGTIPKGVSDVEAALNEITVEKIHTRVHLRPVVVSSFNQQFSLSVASREQIDLVLAYDSFAAMLSRNQLLDMTDLLSERGQGVLDAVGAFISGTMKDGRIYGVTVMGGKAISPHFIMRTDWLEETGVDVGQIVPVDGIMEMDSNLSVVEEIFSKVKEKHPDAQIFVTSLGDSYLERLIVYDGMGDELGVLMDGEGDKVVNLYETEEFKKAVLLAQRWQDMGFMMKDAAMNTATSGSVLLGGNAFCDLPLTQQGVEAQYKQTTGYDFTAVQVSMPLLTTGNDLVHVNVIPKTCSDPEAAMDFLNLLYTDKDVVNLLAYGVEGLHYRFMPDGTVGYPEGITGQNSEYPCVQTWAFGNSLLDYVKVGNVPNLYEIQAQGNETARRSEAFGFMYDSTPVAAEVTACEKIVEQYEKGLLTGALDPEKLDEFNDKLKAAGIDIIIGEKQRQYDAWRLSQEE